MPKTGWQDPGSSEVRSTHISGLQEAIGKIEDILDVQLQAETGIELSEVYIFEGDRYRIYQAPEGKRNWATSPAPVIKKNGVVISTDFTIDYGGGAVIFTTPILGTDTVTADFSRTKTDGNKLATLDAADVHYDNEESELEATDTQAAIDETVDMVKMHKAEDATDAHKPSNVGVVIPTQAEAEAGTNNTKYMTPLRVTQAIAAQAARMITGSYTGDGTNGRPINIGVAPKLAIVTTGAGGNQFIAHASSTVRHQSNGHAEATSGVSISATGLIVGYEGNTNGSTYNYIVFY
jgi:hypothetical protein